LNKTKKGNLLMSDLDFDPPKDIKNLIHREEDESKKYISTIRDKIDKYLYKKVSDYSHYNDTFSYEKELILKSILSKSEMDKIDDTIKMICKESKCTMMGFYESGILVMSEKLDLYEIKYEFLDRINIMKCLSICDLVNEKCDLLLSENKKLGLTSIKELEMKVFDILEPFIRDEVQDKDSEYHVNILESDFIHIEDISSYIRGVKSKDTYESFLLKTNLGQSKSMVGMINYIDKYWFHIEFGEGLSRDASNGFTESSPENAYDMPHDNIIPELCFSRIYYLFEDFAEYAKVNDLDMFKHDKVNPSQYGEGYKANTAHPATPG